VRVALVLTGVPVYQGASCWVTDEAMWESSTYVGPGLQNCLLASSILLVVAPEADPTSNDLSAEVHRSDPDSKYVVLLVTVLSTNPKIATLSLPQLLVVGGSLLQNRYYGA
jgi:hypothetical protein